MARLSGDAGGCVGRLAQPSAPGAQAGHDRLAALLLVLLVIPTATGEPALPSGFALLGAVMDAPAADAAMPRIELA